MNHNSTTKPYTFDSRDPHLKRYESEAYRDFVKQAAALALAALLNRIGDPTCPFDLKPEDPDEICAMAVDLAERLAGRYCERFEAYSQAFRKKPR